MDGRFFIGNMDISLMVWMEDINFSRLYIKALENQILPKQDLHNQADLDGHEA